MRSLLLLQSFSHRQAPSFFAELVFLYGLFQVTSKMWRSTFSLLRIPPRLVKPGSMRRSLQSLGYLALCSHPLSARQFLDRPGRWAVPGYPPRPRAQDQAGKKFERKKQRAVREAAGRSTLGPGQVEEPALCSLPGNRFTRKTWSPGTLLDTEGNGDV